MAKHSSGGGKHTAPKKAKAARVPKGWSLPAVHCDAHASYSVGCDACLALTK